MFPVGQVPRPVYEQHVVPGDYVGSDVVPIEGRAHEGDPAAGVKVGVDFTGVVRANAVVRVVRGVQRTLVVHGQTVLHTFVGEVRPYERTGVGRGSLRLEGRHLDFVVHLEEDGAVVVRVVHVARGNAILVYLNDPHGAGGGLKLECSAAQVVAGDHDVVETVVVISIEAGRVGPLIDGARGTGRTGGICSNQFVVSENLGYGHHGVAREPFVRLDHYGDLAIGDGPVALGGARYDYAQLGGYAVVGRYLIFVPDGVPRPVREGLVPNFNVRPVVGVKLVYVQVDLAPVTGDSVGVASVDLKVIGVHAGAVQGLAEGNHYAGPLRVGARLLRVSVQPGPRVGLGLVQLG